MTQNSMFFSNGEYYTQNMFARFIRDIFGHDGVVDGIDNELEVIANTPANMAVQVKTGRSYVQGYIHEILTDAVQLAISDADPTNPRIDRIVLRLDVNTNRNITVAVLAGTPAASPVAPTLTQTSTIWEVSLAQVRVDANATVINSGNITDERQYMWMNRANMPKASTTEYGSVKVGTGLTVSNGVINVAHDAYLEIPNISITNSGGFAVGKVVSEINDTFTGSGSGITNVYVGSPFSPSRDVSYVNYDPFVIAGTLGNSDIPRPSITVSWGASQIMSATHMTATRVSTGASLGAGDNSNAFNITLPSDWDFDTDQIQMIASTSSFNTNFSFTTQVATAEATVYYKPQAPTP